MDKRGITVCVFLIVAIFYVAVGLSASVIDTSETIIKTSGNDLKTINGSSEVFYFNISHSDAIKKINISVPSSSSDVNYLIDITSLSTNAWICSSYNLSGKVKNIVCENSSIVSSAGVVNLSVSAMANESLPNTQQNWTIIVYTGDDNTENSSTTISTFIDAIIPNVNVTKIMENSSISGYVDLKLNATDILGFNATNMKFRFENSTWYSDWVLISHDSGNAYYNNTYDTNALTDGTYNINVSVSDKAGNENNTVIQNVLVNNMISSVVHSTIDGVAYPGGSDVNWTFNFSVVGPVNCRPRIRMNDFNTTISGTTYNISTESVGATMTFLDSDGVNRIIMVKNHFNDTQQSYVPYDEDGNTTDASSTFTFSVHIDVSSATVSSSYWKNTYAVKCQ